MDGDSDPPPPPRYRIVTNETYALWQHDNRTVWSNPSLGNVAERNRSYWSQLKTAGIGFIMADLIQLGYYRELLKEVVESECEYEYTIGSRYVELGNLELAPLSRTISRYPWEFKIAGFYCKYYCFLKDLKTHWTHPIAAWWRAV